MAEPGLYAERRRGERQDQPERLRRDRQKPDDHGQDRESQQQQLSKAETCDHWGNRGQGFGDVSGARDRRGLGEKPDDAGGERPSGAPAEQSATVLPKRRRLLPIDHRHE
jgi:hypothetical protein